MNNDHLEEELARLREDEAPDVVSRAFARFRRRLLVGGLALAVVVAAVAYFVGRSDSDTALLNEMIGDDHGPFHLVAQEIVGEEEWRTYAYEDSDGRPCLIDTLGGGSCHPHVNELVRNAGADHSTSGTSRLDADGERTEYLVVKGFVASDTASVTIEFDDGGRELVGVTPLPGAGVKAFAVLSEGSIDRRVVEVEVDRGS